MSICIQSKKQRKILASDKFHKLLSRMHSIKVNIYNPFTKPFLGFSVSSKFSNEKYSFNLLDNLDLYHQPLEPPSTAISLFVARFLIIVSGELVLYKLFKMVRKENGLVNEVTQFYCIALMTNYPIWLLFATITEFLHPLKNIMGQWICSLMRVVFYTIFNVVIFQSFVVALMRYCFILHEEKVKSFGKKKIKNVFLFLTIFFPCFYIVWGFIQNQELDAFKNINSCYAIDFKVFLAEVINETPGKHLFCVFDKIDGKHEYILALMGYITCMTKQVILILIGMNVFEGLIYYKIFSHITRYDFQGPKLS